MAPELRSFIPGASGVFAFILGIAITLKVVGLETGNLMTMLGLSTIAIGMSFKDVFVNTIQGVMIIINHTFSVGDEITVRDATGIVVKIDLMYTKIDTGTEIKYIPNSAMFSEIVTLKKK
jgi:small-conductance mechanosensitive channel